MKKIITSVILASTILLADGINDPAKNPSMAVFGTQKVAVATTSSVFPVKASGDSCDITTDTFAVTSDHSSQLICQSGVWNALGGGAVLGLNLEDTLNKETFGWDSTNARTCDTSNCKNGDRKFKVIKSGSNFILQYSTFASGTWNTYSNACIGAITPQNYCNSNGATSSWASTILITDVGVYNGYTYYWNGYL